MTAGLTPIRRTYNHFHLFCGAGGGAKGFNKARTRFGPMEADWRCVGGIDVDATAIRNFDRAAGVKGTVRDLFSRRQYTMFHGHEPPADWREATPEDIRRAAGGERPHCVFLSPPCKGASGLLSETKSKTPKYQALNELGLRGVWLSLEAWKDDPVELYILENVPRLATRGRRFLDQLAGLHRAFGYAVAETSHDCGELGGLAQSRKRFLYVARHTLKVRPFLYEPPKRRLRGVGEVLGKMPLPGDERAGPMHRVPSLQWQTWVRLALVEAGKDWRSLNRLAVENGHLKDYLIVPEMRGGTLGVKRWDEPIGTVAGRTAPSNGAYSVADVRFAASPHWKDGQQYGVNTWEQSAPTIGGQQAPGQGRFAVADVRPAAGKHNNCFRVVKWKEPSGAVTGGTGPSAGGLAVADVRLAQGRGGTMGVRDWTDPSGAVAGESLPSNGAFAVADPRAPEGAWGKGKYAVTDFDKPTGTVIANSGTGQGAFAVADPKPGYGAGTHQTILRVGEWDKPRGAVTGAGGPTNGAQSVADPRPNLGRSDHYASAGHYGVVPWDGTSKAVTAAGKHDNGHGSVADPRLPPPTERGVVVIIAEDGTWHRPFTTAELAALQSYIDPDEHLDLGAISDALAREHIGNLVPPGAAQAVAEEMGEVLLLAESGETFRLTDKKIWVRDIAIAVSLASEHDPAAAILGGE